MKSPTAVRQMMIAKCSALFLVLLIILPFTPPFSTCGLSDLLGEVAADHGPTSAGKVLQDSAPAIGVARAIVPVFRTASIHIATIATIVVPGEIRPSALRL
jgi:hypothetical protein